MFALSHPVWARGRSREINLHLEFDIVLPSGAQTVRLTASTAYQLFAMMHSSPMAPRGRATAIFGWTNGASMAKRG